MAKVRMYLTATCPYCVRAKMLLDEHGVKDIEEIRVDLISGAREAMMTETGRRTVPQIFVGQTHVGGCDDLMALDRAGQLAPMLAVA